MKKIEAETSQDLKKTGEAREAQRRIIQTIDCVGLKGYNSMIVGPASAAARVRALGGVSLNIITSETLTGIANPTEGMVVYLTEADGEYAAEEAYQYKGGSWVLYEATVEES